MRRALATAGAAVVIAVGAVAGSVAFDATERSSTPRALAAASSCQPIGFQSGVAASVARWKLRDPAGATAYTKLERTLALLVYDHDRACAAPAPPPPVTTTGPPPTTTAPPPVGIAPQTYNAVPGGSNARYCTTGLDRNANGRLADAYAAYDDDGRQLGGRSENPVAGLRRADNMNGLSPCQGYSEGGRSFPPWPAASYNR